MQYFFGQSDCGYNLQTGDVFLFKEFQEKYNLEMIILLQQVHSAQGISVLDKNMAQAVGVRLKEGDFLITNQSGIGLAVLTADCLPIFIFDPVKKVIASVHAGWKGLQAGIIATVLEKLQKDFFVDYTQLQFFYGPCAGVCCYQVQQDFKDGFTQDQRARNCFEEKDDKIFFNLLCYSILLFKEYGINQNQINFDMQCCTICTQGYYSVRRLPGTVMRNVSFIALK